MADSGGNVRVGIVGAGIAGSSAAHFVREALGSQAEIVVFERGQTVGGRIRQIEIGGIMVETGASIAHSENRYFAGFVALLGLSPKQYGFRTVGIWNGRSFDFKTAPARWATLLRTLLRYGLAPVRAEKLVKRTVRRLSGLYDLQQQGRGFDTPRELFSTLGLYELSQQPSREFFRQHRVSDRFVQEIVDGVSRNNYGQAADIHALVNLVSLAGAAMGGYLFSVQEGNSMVCRGLLQKANAEIRTGTEVTEIAALSGASTAIAAAEPDTGAPAPPVRGYQVKTAGGDTQAFDAVIVATPLEAAGIQFPGIALPAESLKPRPYQTTHVTLVVGRLNPAYFGLQDARLLPEAIMTRESPEIPFSSLGSWGSAVDSPHLVHKMFSRAETSEELLSQLFSERVQTERLVWKAYPVLRPAREWPPFVLGERLYYVNAMESGASAMETEIMGSRNVVNLLAQAFAHR